MVLPFMLAVIWTGPALTMGMLALSVHWGSMLAGQPGEDRAVA